METSFYAQKPPTRSLNLNKGAAIWAGRIRLPIVHKQYIYVYNDGVSHAQDGNMPLSVGYALNSPQEQPHFISLNIVVQTRINVVHQIFGILADD